MTEEAKKNLEKAKASFKDAAEDTKESLTDAAKKVKEGFKDAAEDTEESLTDAAKKVKEASE